METKKAIEDSQSKEGIQRKVTSQHRTRNVENEIDTGLEQNFYLSLANRHTEVAQKFHDVKSSPKTKAKDPASQS